VRALKGYKLVQVRGQLYTGNNALQLRKGSKTYQSLSIRGSAESGSIGAFPIGKLRSDSTIIEASGHLSMSTGLGREFLPNGYLGFVPQCFATSMF
jgi:hypothetical protein